MKADLSSGAALFLDRDGVLNRRIMDGYVLSPDQFEVLPGVLEALALLAPLFCRVFVVTNQQGIGKGLMTEADLDAIHSSFVRQVAQASGHIDRIYHCPALKQAHSFARKPSIGMALQARQDFPEVVLRHSVMVGDTRTDMVFGRRAGMRTVLVGAADDTAARSPRLVDEAYDSLLDFARDASQRWARRVAK